MGVICISAEEAIARMVDRPMVEVQFETIPNSGTTHCATVERSGLLEMLRQPGIEILEMGPLAQKRNMGIGVHFTHKVHGWGCLAIETKPECRLNKQQLDESVKRGHGINLFSQKRRRKR